MVVPDLATIYDKVAEIETLDRIIVCPFSEILPAVSVANVLERYEESLHARDTRDSRCM